MPMPEKWLDDKPLAAPTTAARCNKPSKPCKRAMTDCCRKFSRTIVENGLFQRRHAPERRRNRPIELNTSLGPRSAFCSCQVPR